MLQSLMQKESRLAIGLMSGTSLDGIDAALVEVNGRGADVQVKLIEYLCQDYTREEREQIKDICSIERSDVESICAMNFYLAGKFADAAKAVVRKAGLQMEEVDFISSHGQTIWHLPDGDRRAAWLVPSTLQIGDISVLAKETGRIVIGDYRPADIALGGQGAPLTPYADYILCRHERLGRIMQNIGGIGNCTVLPPNPGMKDVFAFDTGPGNMVIDQAVVRLTDGKLHYDSNGSMAAAGHVNDELLDGMLNHSYFSKQPVKTTGREMFGKFYADHWIDQMIDRGMPAADIVATFTAFTARSIAESYQAFIFPQHAIHEIIVSGGGARNRTMMKMLQELLPEQKVLTSDEIGIDSDAKEAIAFALMGCAFLDGQPNNLSAVTGARQETVMGKLALP